MKRNETAPQSTVNLFPVTTIACLSLLGVVAALVMLWGLHNKIPSRSDAEMMTVVSADAIGEINLEGDTVRINLMARNANGSVEKMQEIEIPLNKFPDSYKRLKSFWEAIIEKGVLVKTSDDAE